MAFSDAAWFGRMHVVRMRPDIFWFMDGRDKTQ